MRKISLLLLSLAALVSSCSPKDDFQPQVLPSGSAVSITEIEFDPLGGETEFSITSPVSWTVENLQDWFTLTANDKTIKTGMKLLSGHYDMKIVANVNDYSREVGDYRHTTLVIKSADNSAEEIGVDGSLNETIEITQPNPYLRITTHDTQTGEELVLNNKEKDPILFLWDYTEAEPFMAEPMVFTVECNTEWTIKQLSTPVNNMVERESMAEEVVVMSISPYAATLLGDGYVNLDGWLIAPELRLYERNESNTFTFSLIPASYNTTGKDRKLSLAVVGPDGNYGAPIEYYTLEVSHNNVRFNITASQPTPLQFDACYTTPVEIVVDSEIDWTVENDYGWISLNPQNPGAQCNKESLPTSFTVDINHPGCTENANPEERIQEGNIRVVATGGTTRLPIEVQIQQEPYQFQLSQQSIHFGNNEITPIFFDLTTSGAWEVESCPDWITTSPLNGDGIESGVHQPKVYIKANSQNLNLTDNQGSVVFKSTLNSLKQEMSIVQDRFIFEADTENESDKRLLTMDTSSHNVNVKSSGNWDVTIDYEDGDSDWLSLSSASGYGDGSFSFHANDGNDNTFERRATLVIHSTTHSDAGVELAPIEIEISQRKYEFEVAPLPESAEFNYGPVEEDGRNVEIICSATWEITAPSWIKFNHSSSGQGDATITFTADNNTEYEPRDGTISISSTYGEFSNTFTYNVHQDEFIFEVTPTLFEELAPVDAAECSISIECSSSWTITTLSTSAGWVIPSVTKGSGDLSVRLDVSDNPLTSARSGDVMVFSTVNSDSRNVVIKQKKYEFDDTPVDISATTLTPQTEKIEVVCSGNWHLNSKPDWIDASPDSGKGDGTMVLTIHNNYNLSERTSTDFVLYSELNQLTRAINVTQAAFIFDTERVELSEYTALMPTEQSVVLGDIMASWELDDVPAWITPSMSEGVDGGHTITFKAMPNYTLMARSATIKLKSQYYNNNNELCKEIVVSQAPFLFPTSTIEHNFDELNELSFNAVLGNIMASWEVVGVPEWLSTTPTVAGESATSSLLIEAEPNYQLSSRSAELTIESEYVEENPELSRQLTISQDAFIFDNTTLEVTPFEPIDAVSYTTKQAKGSAEWSVRSKPEWLNVEVDKPNDEWSINITATDNIQTKKRSGEIIIESQYYSQNSDLRRIINVMQKEYLFDDATTNFTLEPLDKQTTLDVVCSGEWTITGVPAWAHLDLSGKGSKRLTMTFDANYEQSENRATMTLTSNPNGLTRTINLTQKPFLFDTTKATLDVEANASSFNVTLMEATSTWSVKNIPSWVESVVPSSGSGMKEFTITTSHNPYFEERSATLRVESDHIAHNSALYKEIVINQAAFEYDTTPVTLNESPALDAEAQQVVLASSTLGWSIKDVPSWAEVSPMSGSGSATITIRAKDNTSLNTRKATLRIESELIGLNAALVKEVTISQEAYEFDSAAATLSSFAAMNATSQSVRLSACTGSWYSPDKPSWITLSPASGEGAATITVGAQNNTSESARSATFTIVSRENESLKKSISVSQDGYTFTVASSSLTFEASATKAQNVAVECSGSWSVSDDASWLTATKSGSNVVITPTANKDKSQRTAKVTVKSDDNSALTRTINVTQAAAK